MLLSSLKSATNNTARHHANAQACRMTVLISSLTFLASITSTVQAIANEICELVVKFLGCVQPLIAAIVALSSASQSGIEQSYPRTPYIFMKLIKVEGYCDFFSGTGFLNRVSYVA